MKKNQVWYGLLIVLTVVSVLAFTAAAQGSYTIWPATTVPAVANSGPDSPVELGVKFRSDTGGFIKGIRFYKAATNTGTHVGNLWTASGTLLARATFSNETASGWQQVIFPTPVAINANTVYVASYHTNVGSYFAEQRFFTGKGADSPPLHALADGVSGFNGVFMYSATSGFPNQGWNSSNYWIDVIFDAAQSSPPSSISLTPADSTVKSGATQQFTASGIYADGSTQDLSSQAVWASSTPTVATISNTGLVTAFNPGRTTISATSNGITGSTSLLVEVSPLAITSSSLPSGALKAPYSAVLEASGGISPYTWSITSGSLPTGIILSSATGALSGTPTTTGTFNFTMQLADSSNPVVTTTKALSITIAEQATFTLWPGTTVPALADSGPDSPVELGVRFSADSSGFITGIRFYKAATNTGTHVGSLWSSSGTLLATATFINETASGWQQVNFSTPVAITANTVYVASYHSTAGHYSADQHYFTGQGVDSPPLHALASGGGAVNGVYAYGSSSRFPNLGWNGTNYWVDVVLNSTPPPTLSTLVVAPVGATLTSGATQQFAATGTYSDGSTQDLTHQVSWSSSATSVATISSAGLATAINAGSTTISATLSGVTGTVVLTVSQPPLNILSAPLPGGTLSVSYSALLKASGGTLPYLWTITSGSLPPGLSLNSTTGAISGIPTATGSFSFTAQVTDASNPTQTSTMATSINVVAQTSFTLWPLTAVPGLPDSGPDMAVELGVRFRADVNGSVTGVRFYKAATNTGTHVGNLWSSSGTLLASAPFTDETASGWQEARFSAPVAINADTVYVASYHSNNGHYSADENFFSGKGIDSPPLHALANDASGLNGVYRYGATSGFPNQGWKGANYWVDLIFSPAPTPDTTAPTITAFTIPATAASLTVPISSFTANDSVGVTGYLVTESATAPAPTLPGWTALAPTSYTFATEGTKILYGWAKDAAGNVSASKSASIAITLPDTTAPTVTAFTIPATAASLTVPISSFTANDSVGVTGYLVTESATAPAPTLPGWTAVAPTSYTFATEGTKILYGWAKDAVGNVSASRNASIAITLPDTTAPTVTAFTIPATATSLTVPISSFTANDSVGVTGYLVTESATAPAPTLAEWTATVPASYTFLTAGNKTLYAWAKDVAGNISASLSASVAIALQSTGPEPVGWYAGDMHVHRSCKDPTEPVASLYQKMEVHNLSVISLLADMGNGEVQDPIADLPRVNGGNDAVSTPGRILHWDTEWHWDPTYDQYSHHVLGGHVVALGLSEAQQNFSEYTYPVLNWAHQQNAIAGFAHMQYLDGSIPANLNCCTPLEYPVEVALGAADFISEDVADVNNIPPGMHPEKAIEAYYRLLNCGFRPGLAAGTDYPCSGGADPGSLLTYVQVAGGEMTYRNWIEGIAKGRTVISRNGHNEFLELKVNGTAAPGDEVKLAGAGVVPVTISWTAKQELTGTIELVHNGVVVASKPASVAPGTAATLTATVDFTRSGWVAARRMGSAGHQLHTAAVFVTVNNAPVRASVDDATFYVQWIDNLLEKTSPGGAWESYFVNSRSAAQSRYRAAKELFQQIALEAGTPPVDTTAPVVTALTIPATATTLSIPVTAFTVTDDVAATGYLLSESATVPAPTSAGWTAAAPTSYRFTTQGQKILYGWAKDAAGNVSASRSASVTIAVPITEPILIISSPSYPFSSYYEEILKAEGFNLPAVRDISAVTPALLASYDVVILGEMPMTAAQVSLLSDWVYAGGKLIAMRPDKKLANLLGLNDQASTMSDAYLLVNTSSGPGKGIVGETMQFHGAADIYGLDGASTVATLYSSATSATSSPAVTVKNVGTNGGQAAAFTYDLARSIILTRQGNPAWAGQERDGLVPIRSDDLFYGAASFDPRPDWVDPDKLSIPQADEQQRLLANLVVQMSFDKKPLPRFWYLPRNLPAVVVMTGDDHGNGGTAGRFDSYLTVSPPGCSLQKWECIRGTSYIYTESLTEPQATAYDAAGFEVALHLNTRCADWSPLSLESFYASQLSAWGEKYPRFPAPATNRTHCVAWSDFATQPLVELAHGIRLDTTFYYWPSTWVADVPGFLTGSALPMRFADSSGRVIDVYQAATQMTDESGQTYPYTIDTLLNRATGPEGYYGVYTVNAHTDVAESTVSDAVVGSAMARGIPVVTARQMLTWLDGRNGSSFGPLSYNGTTLSFSITVDDSAYGLVAMLPEGGGKTVARITKNGVPVPYTTVKIKGISYARFSAENGAYQADFASDLTPPTVSGVTPVNGAADISVMVHPSLIFSEEMNPATVSAGALELRDSARTLVPATVTYDAATLTATLIPSTPLSISTTYTATVKAGGAKDSNGNPIANDFSWSFTTVAAGPGVYSIWPDTATPQVPDSGPDSPVELGVKFRSDIDGYITGIRFYKTQKNTGTHVGSLWSIGGTLLARATFTNETSSGWQQMNFSAPLAISANTVYVASYHTSAGSYSLDEKFFAVKGVDSPPLHALADGVSGANGLYRYSSASSFPNLGWRSTNYWVDVVFAPAVAQPLTVSASPQALSVPDQRSFSSAAPAKAPVTLSFITVAPGNQRIAVGSSQLFTAKGTYSDGSTKDVTKQAVWLSSNTKVVTIDSAGLATGVNDGTATISATLNGVTGSTKVVATEGMASLSPGWLNMAR